MKKKISLALVAIAMAVGAVVYANIDSAKPGKPAKAAAQKECCTQANCTPSANCPAGACTPDQCKDVPGCVCPK